MLCSILSIAVTLHWNPFGLYWGTLVMFVFLFFPSLSPALSPLVSWIDFSFVLDSRDAQCWFQLYGGCFIACSVFVYGGIPQFHSAHKRIPSGRAYPSVLCSSNIPEMDQANIWSLTQTHQCVQICTYICTHRYACTNTLVQTPARWLTYMPRNTLACKRAHTTNRHLHTQYLLLYHIAVNPVKKLCGERK